MNEGTRRPDVTDVLTAIVLIVVGTPLAMSMLFIFIGVPMMMAGVELLTTAQPTSSQRSNAGSSSQRG